MGTAMKRVEWIDYYKAILIILVIIGHSTGILNMYIYQYHMAAFFFISGFCTNWNYPSKVRLVLERLYSLVLPLCTIFFLGTISLALLNKFGVYSYLFDETLPYIGLKQILYRFFTFGDNFVWWMGATWFVFVLAGIYLLHSIYIFISLKSIKYYKLIYAIMIGGGYLAGWYACQHGFLKRYSFDLILIGQLYFGIGALLCNSKLKTYNISFLRNVIGILITSVILYYMSKITNITVDFPARKFNHIFINVLASLNGIIFTIFLAHLLESIPVYKIKKLFSYIGRNTMPVMFFHFLMFKICYVILVFYKVIDWEYLKNTTPGYGEIGYRFLPLFIFISIFGSIIVWNMLNRIPLLSFLLGNEKKKINDSRIEYYAVKLKLFCDYILYESKLILTQWHNIIRGKKKLNIFSAILFSIVIISFIGQVIRLNNEPINITFPYYNTRNNIFLEGGWLEQVPSESYRWIKGTARINFYANDETDIYIEGLVPENVTEVGNIEIFLNSKRIYEQKVDAGTKFVIEVNAEKNIFRQEYNEVEIVFDGIHMPKETDQDVREFSALISRIGIE